MSSAIVRGWYRTCKQKVWLWSFGNSSSFSELPYPGRVDYTINCCFRFQTFHSTEKKICKSVITQYYLFYRIFFFSALRELTSFKVFAKKLTYTFIFAGGNPYDGMSGQEVFTYVSHGHKLRRSSGVSRELYVESRSIYIHTYQ